jgi:hypothetical protein
MLALKTRLDTMNDITVVIISQEKQTKQVTEESSCQSQGICYLYQSGNAVDGNIDTCTRTRPLGSSNPHKMT